MHQAFNEVLNNIIEDRVKHFRQLRSIKLNDNNNEFEKLFSLGELVDRLTIVNIKLFNLKDDVMKNQDSKFRAWAAEHDVHLVSERAKLKRCIDQKVQKEVDRIITTGKSSYNKEIKKYG